MPASPKDLVLANAPLIEVIAELRWHLVPVQSIPGAALDPYYDLASQQFGAQIAAQGFTVIELLVPIDVPKELVAGQPISRFRKQPNQWPLYQIGPGIFSANITPPYNGWKRFVPTLKEGIDCLLKSYPAAKTLLKLQSITLRYLDGFIVTHGRNDVFNFLHEGLGITLKFPDEIFAKSPTKTPASAAVEMSIPVSEPKDSTLIIKVLPGRRDNVDATILDIALQRTAPQIEIETTSILNWYEAAHLTLSHAFKSLTTPEVKKLMGPEVEV